MPTLRIAKENEDKMHFITITVLEWINIFTKERYFKALAHSLEYCRKHKGLYLLEYMFMTNHIHLIIAPKRGTQLPEILKSFKSFTTSEIDKLLAFDNRKYIPRLLRTSTGKKEGNKNQIWQRENKPQVIVSESYFAKWQNYIWMNPVKEGYVEAPEHWKWSSAGYRLTGEKGPIGLDDEQTFWDEYCSIVNHQEKPAGSLTPPLTPAPVVC